MCSDVADGTVASISVVLPAHNEEAILRATVDDLLVGFRERGTPFEIVIVENGSTDGTWQLAEALEREHPEVRVLTAPVPDYGVALRTGLLTATGDVVVTFDVDYYDLGFSDEGLRRIASEGAAIVIGSKRGEGADDTRALPRRIVTGVFTTILRRGYGLRASDTHGMKVLHRGRVLPLVERCHLGSDLFDTELVLRAERSGRVVVEVPVRVEERRPARTSIIRRIPRTLFGLRKLRGALRDT